MIDIKMNISEFIRDVSKWKGALHRIAGKRLGEQVLAAYERLVNETPQWSGTTAASWSIGFGGAGGMVDLRGEVPFRDRDSARWKGHARAVGIGLSRVDSRIANSSLEAYKTQDIVIANESPNFDIAEDGVNLRDVNQPGGMFARFQQELDGIIIDLDSEMPS